MVRIATDQEKLYSPRVIKIANQVSKVSVNHAIRPAVRLEVSQSISLAVGQTDS